MDKAKHVILVRYGELFLKGNNRSFFEKLAINNIKESLKDYNFFIEKIDGRYIISNYETKIENELIQKVTKVFGLHSVSPALEIETNTDEILKELSKIKLTEKTFRVTVKRADKMFEIPSQEFSAICGGIILENNNIKVDVHNPEVEVVVDIRQNKKTYLSHIKIICQGGLPVGSSGTGLSLLSGGIDSPVASYLIAKRGMKIEFLHFFSYPYTSDQAKEKVINLAKIVKQYSLSTKIFMINFSKVQEEIHKHCNNDYMILIMRRIMMKLSKILCEKYNLQAIITGENLGQVASQTIENISLTNLNSENFPVLRPLIGLDKEDIVQIAKKIGSFETSILPYEDCCTVFLPKSPIIKGKLDNLEKEEKKLDIDELIMESLSNIEIIKI